MNLADIICWGRGGDTKEQGRKEGKDLENTVFRDPQKYRHYCSFQASTKVTRNHSN